MLNRDSEIKILNILRACDMNSTLGSVVPLAMFVHVKEMAMIVINAIHCGYVD